MFIISSIISYLLIVDHHWLLFLLSYFMNFTHPTRPSFHAWNMWNLLHWLRRCIVVAADQCCEICGADAMSERFYAFTCTHCCHEACLRPSDLQWLFSPLPILFVCAQNVLVANMQFLHACTGGYCLISFVFIYTHRVAMITHPLFNEVWLAGIVMDSTLLWIYPVLAILASSCDKFRTLCFALILCIDTVAFGCRPNPHFCEAKGLLSFQRFRSSAVSNSSSWRLLCHEHSADPLAIDGEYRKQPFTRMNRLFQNIISPLLVDGDRVQCITAACVFERWGALAGTDGKAWNIWRSFCRNSYQWMCFACGNSQNTIALTVRPTALHVQEARLQHQAAAAGAAAKPGSALAEVGMSICAATDRSCNEQGQLISMFGMHRCIRCIRLHSFWRTVGMNHEELKNHEANSCQDTSSLSTWKFRAKVNKFAGGRWAGWHPCGGLPFLWATHDWHHHEAFHWSEGIWRSWRNWVVGDMIFLHDQSWRMSFAGKDCSCTNSRDHHVVWISWTNLQPSDSWTQ